MVNTRRKTASHAEAPKKMQVKKLATVTTSRAATLQTIKKLKPIVSEFVEQNPKYRKTMEDEHDHRLGMCDGILDGFVVFDGHGGGIVSKYAKSVLFDMVEKELETLKPTRVGLRQCIENVVAAVEKKFLGNKKYDHVGSTMILCLLNKKTKYLVCGNLGDSRAILCLSGGNTIDLSEDHKPDTAKESARLKKLPGAFVTNQRGDVARVNGNLAVSRALADMALKRPYLYVSNKVDISITLLNSDPFTLVLVCDGVTDVKTSAQVGEIISREKDKKKLAERLGRAALHDHTTDNVSVLVACYNKWY